MNKVSKEDIKLKIADKKFIRLTDKITHCVLTLRNGFEVTGESACVDPKNYDREIGERLAYDNAFEKIWMLEGYLLQEKISLKKNRKEYPVRPEDAFKRMSTVTKREPYGKDAARGKEPNSINFGDECGPFSSIPSDFPLMRGLYESEKKDLAPISDPEQVDESQLSDQDKFRKFNRMFPGATENDFKKLLNRQVVTDELSFMEKYEKIMEVQETNGSIEDSLRIYTERQIKFNKLVRQELDIIIQAIKGSERKSPERSTAIRKAIEATMWMGIDLKSLGTDDPYPESRNPENTKVEPTADGLKM